MPENNKTYSLIARYIHYPNPTNRKRACCAVNADGLTNEYNEIFDRVTISQNQLFIFYANTPVFVGTIFGVLTLLFLIIFLLMRKKKDKTAA